MQQKSGQMLGSLIKNACKMRGITLAKACRVAGINYSTLHSQIKNSRPIPFETVDRLSDALNLPIRLFSQSKLSVTVKPSKQARTLFAENSGVVSGLTDEQVSEMASWSNNFGTDDVLDWLLVNESRLVNHEWLFDHVDLFYPVCPNDRILRPYRIGPKSLAAKFFRAGETNDFKKVLTTFEKPHISKVIQDHIDLVERKYVISEQTIDTEVKGIHIFGTYRRLMAPVIDKDGQKYTLIFSKLTQFSSR